MTCDYLTARGQTQERRPAAAPGLPGAGPSAGPAPRRAASRSPLGGPGLGWLGLGWLGLGWLGPGRLGLGRLGFALICCGAAMLPWLAVLAMWVPASTRVWHWSTAWVGLDALEGAGLFLTGWLLRRGDPRYGLAAMATAVALTIDAWFDVTTSAPDSSLVIAVVMAAVAELPMAALCTVLALRAVGGDDQRYH